MIVKPKVRFQVFATHGDDNMMRYFSFTPAGFLKASILLLTVFDFMESEGIDVKIYDNIGMTVGGKIVPIDLVIDTISASERDRALDAAIYAIRKVILN